MAKGHKTGGRTVGTPNRKTQEISALLESLSCNPIEGMARIATNEAHSPELRGRMFAELAQYVYPKRKAVELAWDPVTPPQSKLVVEFVRARPTTVEDTDANTHTAQHHPSARVGHENEEFQRGRFFGTRVIPDDPR